MQSNFSVIIVDNFSNSHQKTWEILKKKGKEQITLYDIDIRDSKLLEEIFEKEEIGIVFHFASKNKQKESCLEPFIYYESNIQGTINLLKIMEKKEIKNLIYSSSSSVYDVDKSIPPFSENDKLNARTPFATTKIIIEQILKDMNIHKHFNIFCLRYFNPIGAIPEEHL
ncbi:NAD-dependent epimerase/dehydratase family protein [bacterium]|nr:NAD-dependent epimerase/dehydratase family protein [bacterium]